MSVFAMGLVLWTFRFLLARVSEVGVAYMSLQELIFNMYRSLVVQSNRLPTVNWPLRLVIAAWYLYCYYIYALYSGTLTAVLAIPAYERPLDTLSEILEATKQGLIPVIIRGSSFHYLFKTATSGIYYDLGQHITGDMNYVDDPPSGITKVSGSEMLI
ncbi:hypothetical protein Pcinc_001535 [Petrolisthes cinctipes]|uniref:Ionotropic glutamate receptor C-terminal domain-containing protein n=1 Tax=Petrolisthes cinctipes TaxID=88211 RepID=A0AAE1GN61_PETCI|nr:hypothetical protein Pcinc_001535 [Petrolisthes cinctipes]